LHFQKPNGTIQKEKSFDIKRLKKMELREEAFGAYELENLAVLPL